MIMPNDLKMGQCYFLVSFYDRGLQYPRIRTMFYIGKNIFEEQAGKDRWYFQDADTYLNQGTPKNESEAVDLAVLALDADALPLVETIEGIIETLNDMKENKLKFKHKP
jgi:hypothetical protein